MASKRSQRPDQGGRLGYSFRYSFRYTSGMSRSAAKIRENRARRAIERRGYRLEKSRRRDPQAWDYGTYQIVEYSASSGAQLVYAAWPAGRGWGLTLDDVEAWLTGLPAQTAAE